MQKKIVIASILKPVNDARMYEKIAISLSRLEGYEIHIAGFSGQAAPPSNIYLNPIFSFKRLSFPRFLAPWKFYKFLLKVKPEYILISTHELLIVTCIYKILFGGKIFYDVQENYYRNIAYTNSFPPVLRQLVALYVRSKEVLTRPFISHYFLAERNYENEFSFTRGKSTILENKTRQNLIRPLVSYPILQEIRLLYSGTISENYGVFEAVELAVQLHTADPRIQLLIIGYSAKNHTLTRLKDYISPYPFIELRGGNQLVPHEEILTAITQSHFGLISYLPNKSTINCIPTKLYEYLAFGLPMIAQPNPVWDEILAHYNAGISIDFARSNPPVLLSDMLKKSFYSKGIPGSMYWEFEEKKLLKLFR